MSLLTSLTCLCVCDASSVAVAQSAETLPTLEQVRAGLEETLLTIDSLAVDFEVTYERSEETPTNILLPQEPIKWSWYKSGKQELIEGFPHNVGMKPFHMRVAISGDQVTRANFDLDQANEMVSLMKSRHTSEFYDQISPANFWGLRLYGSDVSLSMLLNLSSCKVVRKDVVLGEH